MTGVEAAGAVGPAGAARVGAGMDGGGMAVDGRAVDGTARGAMVDGRTAGAVLTRRPSDATPTATGTCTGTAIATGTATGAGAGTSPAGDAGSAPGAGAAAAQQAGGMLADTGVVAIGRNEGERLRGCLASVAGRVACVVYVDSGSTDGSESLARQFGAEVVALDMTRPFTAARARNAGLQRLRERLPGVRRVQFVDGDCEVVPGWLARAHAFLDAEPRVAAVCGRRRERHPERTVYNRLCDLEWDTPIGEARACGGDAMMRVEALAAVGGYRDDLIAGEEPELCVRLRAAGWRVHRLDAEMTRHDAAMTRFGQWWRRTLRSGYAFAQGAALHGAPPERHWVRETRSALAWGAGVPLAALVAIVLAGAWGALVLLAYPAQVARLALRAGRSEPLRWRRPLFLVLGKLPEALGVLRFRLHRMRGRHGALIEYK